MWRQYYFHLDADADAQNQEDCTYGCDDEMLVYAETPKDMEQ